MQYCDRPFNYIHIYPNGDVKVCAWTNKIIGNLINENLEDMWYGQIANDVRESIIDGSYRFCNSYTCPWLPYNKFKNYQSGKKIPHVQPLDIPISISAAYDWSCNLACTSCRSKFFVHTDESRKNVDVITNKLKPVVKRCQHLSVTGNGEIFTSTSIMSLLESLKPDRSDFKLTLETNGILANEASLKRISHLWEYQIDASVTLHSFNRNTYKLLSGGIDAVDKVVENLYYLSELRRKNIINRLNISSVVQAENFRELPDFVERCFKEYTIDELYPKTIFRWFSLVTDEELFWYKNISNPLHPDYDDWIKITKDLRLDSSLYDNKLWFWGAKHEYPPEPHPRENKIKKINNYLQHHNYKKICIYGAGKNGKKLYDYLNIIKGIEIACFLESCKYGKGEYSYKGLKVEYIEDFNDYSKIDAIIVTPVKFYDEIICYAKNLGIPVPVVTFKELLNYSY